MAVTKFRSYNPVWLMADLTGNLLDDQYYAFFLSNTIPYQPINVFNDDEGAVILPNPLQFQANGTLTPNLFFTPNETIRIEIRKGNTQQDELIYLIENYLPDSSGGGSSSTQVNGNNQAINPQFALVNIPSEGATFTTAGTYNIAPGWNLVLTGAGTAVVQQVPLTSTANTPTNAPYALDVNLTGWTTAFLVQRYEQNGVLWRNKFVAGQITARLEDGSPGSLIGTLETSAGTSIALFSGTATSVFAVISGVANATNFTNTDIPPDAYVEFKLALENVNYQLTSLQVVPTNVATNVLDYEQETIQRQIDQTFHYYKPQLEYKPISSYTLGWDFAFNPCQALGFSVGTQNTGDNGSAYIADQTIVFQTDNETISATFNDTGMILATAADTSFSIIQYLDNTTAVNILNQEVSMMVRAGITTGSGTINARANLYWTENTSVPNIKASDYDSLVTSITSGVPAVVSGWNEVPVVNSVPATFTIGTTMTEFPLSIWDGRLAASGDINSATFFAVVITFENIVTTQQLTMKYASLVPGSIPTPPAPLNKEQTLKGLQYYYEMTYPIGTLPGTNQSANCIAAPQIALNPGGAGGTASYAQTFTTNYEYKRAIPSVTFYSRYGVINSILITTYVAGVATLDETVTAIGGTPWVASVGQTGTFMISNSASEYARVGSTSVPYYSVATYHVTIDARFGVV